MHIGLPELLGSEDASEMNNTSKNAGSGAPPEARYANYFEIGFNEVEVVMDFAQSYGPEAVSPRTRIVTSPTYARQFLEVLSEALVKHDRAYGPGHE